MRRDDPSSRKQPPTELTDAEIGRSIAKAADYSFAGLRRAGSGSLVLSRPRRVNCSRRLDPLFAALTRGSSRSFIRARKNVALRTPLIAYLAR